LITPDNSFKVVVFPAPLGPRNATNSPCSTVLLHAVTDALLGAASLGDIGEWFPDTDPSHQGRDSREMLVAAYQGVKDAGFQLVNLDCIIFAQRPKLKEDKPRIQRNLAELLQVELDRVGVKAKTGERVGPVGREEAMMAECVVLLAKRT
jgi:2-C-methyl-D-erythritol 2,4-cyclodiphosphate synthase